MTGRRPNRAAELFLPHVLRARAGEPPWCAFRFLADGTAEQAVDWTYRDMAEHAATVAAELFRRRATGERVMLALEPGLPYIAALVGILWAGATAVPSFPPTGRRAVVRFDSIVADCQPVVAIVDEELAAARPPAAASTPWLGVGAEFFAGRTGTDWPDAVPTAPALVQYTSGSTGRPRGVVLTHENLASNSDTIIRHLGVEADRVGCSWLPPYHDMGLLGTIILSIHGGWPLVLMSPVHFAQRPYRWLRAMTDHGVTISIAPNFAFDLCVDTVTDDELATLDLSRLRQVFCGSEPVLWPTAERFCRRFAACGYDGSAFMPCYGLAEATLFVSARAGRSPVRVLAVDAQALGRGLVRPVDPTPEPDRLESARLVSCGVPAPGHDVLLVGADGRRVETGQVGEIWVSGPNVASGYHARPKESAATFAIRPAGAGDGPTYLRTGDLGFRRDEELYVTGRIKDLVVIDGRNLYPQDIEASVQRANPRVRRAVAFATPARGPERLVIVAELRHTPRLTRPDLATIREAVVAAVASDHGVRPADVHFGPAGTIPTTTSGKVQRGEARQAYLTGTLKRLSTLASTES